MYSLYSKAGLLIEEFQDSRAANYAYKHWANAWTLFYNGEIIKSKW